MELLLLYIQKLLGKVLKMWLMILLLYTLKTLWVRLMRFKWSWLSQSNKSKSYKSLKLRRSNMMMNASFVVCHFQMLKLNPKWIWINKKLIQQSKRRNLITLITLRDLLSHANMISSTNSVFYNGCKSNQSVHIVKR